jgi:hypothetical protein
MGSILCDSCHYLYDPYDSFVTSCYHMLSDDFPYDMS